MASLRQICLLCVLPAILLAGEPVLIKTPAEANSSPYDNLRIGVPVFTDYVIDREWFCIGFSRKHRQPLWVQYRLLATEVENKVVERSNNFHKDLIIPESPIPKDYVKSGYDRGHMAPARRYAMVARGHVGQFLDDQYESTASALQPGHLEISGGVGSGMGKKRKGSLCDLRPNLQGKYHDHWKRNNSRSRCVLQNRV